MILLREIQEGDLDSLAKFAQIPGFINLQDDRDFLREKIGKSVSSFNDQLPNKFDGKYIFVAEELETRRVLGTSMIAAQHGTTESPHFYFEVSSEEKFSETINTGFIHGTLKLKYDTNGPSEIGGLVLDPVSQRVSSGGQTVEIGPTEYRLLAFFMTHQDRAYTRAQMLDQVWGGNVYVEDRTIDVHIRRLRKVLEPSGHDRFIQTVRGTGYRFSTRVD